MKHSEIYSSMADYLDGDLSLGKRALFDAHLDTCEDCAGELSELRGTIAALKSLPDPELPPTFTVDVMRRVRQGEGKAEWWDRFADWMQTLLLPRFTLPATAVATALAILFVTGQLDLSSPDSALERSRLADRAAKFRRPEVQVLIQFADAGPVVISEPVVISDPMAIFAAPGGGREYADVLATIGGSSRTRSGPASHRFPNVTRAVGESGIYSSPHLGLRSPARRFGATPVAAEVVSARNSRTLGWDRALAPAVDASLAGQATSARSDKLLDDRLRRLRRNPVRFARRQRQLSIAEQELWAKQLADRAADLEILDEVLQVLNDTGDVDAVALAGALGGGGQSVGEPMPLGAEAR